uniref:SLP adapter and CSK-interacting membrane protein n=1 Tax=Catagonus wagneri TaxID=51154 RepID=A0A8C3VRC3_9CETA
MALDWWRDNFWLILAVAIIFVSTSLGIILFCVCRRLLRQGMTILCCHQDGELVHQEVKQSPKPNAEPLGQKYINTIASNTFLCILAPQETSSLPPAAYSSVNKVQKKKTVAALSYMEPENDYDDVDVPASMENRHLETAISSFWQPEEGSHNLF